MPKVDLCFPVLGQQIPADHGYLLYSAVSRLLPAAHQADSYGIHPIRGRQLGGRTLQLTEHSRLVIRTDAEQIARFLPLAKFPQNLGSNASFDHNRLSASTEEMHSCSTQYMAQNKCSTPYGIKGYDTSGPINSRENDQRRLEKRPRGALYVCCGEQCSVATEMNNDFLANQIIGFLKTPQAFRLAKPFHTNPMEAAGDIFLRLSRRIPASLDKPDKWIAVNCRLHLRNYLIRDAKARSRLTLSEGEKADLRNYTIHDAKSRLRRAHTEGP